MSRALRVRREIAVLGSVGVNEPDWTGVPMVFWNKVSAVCRSLKDCNDLVKWFDNQPNFCPNRPILLLIPGIDPPPLICGMGYATAAELRDCALECWTVKRDRFHKLGSVLDFDALRERNGEMPREKVAEAVAYAYSDRIARHKASPVTDPWKQFKYPNPTKKTVFAEQPAQEWKGEDANSD